MLDQTVGIVSEIENRRQTATIRVGKRGQVVIPAAIRASVALTEGAVFRAILDQAGDLVLKPIRADPVERLRLAFAGVFDGVDATEYISGLRDEWER